MMESWQIKMRVEMVKVLKEKGELEAAEEMEKELWKDVLQAIADRGVFSPKEAAFECLKTLQS